MGSELVDGSIPREESKEDQTDIFPNSATFTEIFYNHFPFYLAIGMTYDEYWNMDSTLVRYYRKAEEIRRKLKNEELWLQGMYIYEALCDVSPVLHAFAKAGTRPIPYSKAPYPLTEQEYRERQEQDKRERIALMRKRLEAMVKSGG